MGKANPRHTKDINKYPNTKNAYDVLNKYKSSTRSATRKVGFFKPHFTERTDLYQTIETSSNTAKMAEVKITTDAPKLSDYSLYSDYKDNVLLWDIITDIPKSKRGAFLLIGIKNEHANFGSNIQRQLFQKHRPAEIATADDGVQKILDFLDTHIGKPSKSLKFTCLREIVEYKRSAGQEFSEYAKNFEYLVSKAENAGLTTLSADIKAGFLMNNANLTAQQIELLNSVVDLSDDEKLYENIKSKMFDMLTNVFGLQKQNNTEILSDAFLAQHEQAFAAWTKNKSFQKSNYQKPNYQNKGNNYQSSAGYNNSGNYQNNSGTTNPKDQRGRILQCRLCMSIKHLQRECPYNLKNKNSFQKQRQNKQAFVVEGENSDSEDDIPEPLPIDGETNSDNENSQNTSFLQQMKKNYQNSRLNL